MATLYPTVLKTKTNSQGLTKVRIALSHKHQTAYLTTPILVKPNEFKNGRVVKRQDESLLNKRIAKYIQRYQDRLDDIDDLSVTCSQLKRILERKGDFVDTSTTFQTIAEIYTQKLISEDRKGYADILSRHCKKFSAFLKGDFPLSLITPDLIVSFRAELNKKESISETTVNRILAHVKVIVNYAIKKGFVTYQRHPFDDCEISQAPRRENFLTLEDFKKIKDADFDSRNEILARDMFMLSYYLGGINFIDLIKANLSGDRLVYIRTKVKRRNPVKVDVVICARAREIINRYIGKNGTLSLGYKYSDQGNLLRYITRNIGGFKTKLGLSDKPTFYSARKCFAQFAFTLGYNDAVIDYCLGHAEKKDTIHFYRKADSSMADKVILDTERYIE